MKYYRLHINGQPTDCHTHESNVGHEHRQGYEWIHNPDYKPVFRPCRVICVDGTVDTFRSIDDYHRDTLRRITTGEPVGLQCLPKAWRVAA